MDPAAPPRRTRPASGAAVAPRRHVSGPLATAAPPEPGIGDVLGGRYRIDSELGYGGMAHVYRARDELLQRDVAIKVFRSNVSEAVDPKRTTREMHILASLSHPAVVSVLDASDAPQSGAYIVMELVDGDDLGTALRAGPVPPEQARRIAGDVASALEALHARSIVHRDVKPANILVLSEAAAASGGIAAKLTDFGIAQLIDGTRITGPESILGTAAFLSPEQVRAERVGPASDVYSLGLVLLECLTGERVFPGSGAETAVARLTRAPAIPPTVSPPLADLLRRMTAVDPAVRPPAGEVAEQLREHLVGRMLAGEDTRTAQTPAFPMAAVAAASMPLATGPVRATGAFATTGGTPTGAAHTGAAATSPPTGSAAFLTAGTGGISRVAGTGGIGTAFPDALPLVEEQEDPARRRRRLGLLSALIGAFAALVAAAAIVIAMMPTTAPPAAPVERQTGSAPASAPSPADARSSGSSGSGASSGSGSSSGAGSSRSSAGATSSSSASSGTGASTSSSSSPGSSSGSSSSASSSPTGGASSGSSAGSTPSTGSSSGSSSASATTAPSSGSSAGPSSAPPTSSSSSSSSASSPSASAPAASASASVSTPAGGGIDGTAG